MTTTTPNNPHEPAARQPRTDAERMVARAWGALEGIPPELLPGFIVVLDRFLDQQALHLGCRRTTDPTYEYGPVEWATAAGAAALPCPEADALRDQLAPLIRPKVDDIYAIAIAFGGGSEPALLECLRRIHPNWLMGLVVALAVSTVRAHHAGDYDAVRRADDISLEFHPRMTALAWDRTTTSAAQSARKDPETNDDAFNALLDSISRPGSPGYVEPRRRASHIAERSNGRFGTKRNIRKRIQKAKKK